MFLSQSNGSVDSKSGYDFKRYPRSQANNIQAQRQLTSLYSHCQSSFKKFDYPQCIIYATKALKLIAAHPQKFANHRHGLLYLRAQSHLHCGNYVEAVQDACDHQACSGTNNLLLWLYSVVDNFYSNASAYFNDDDWKQAIAYAKKGRAFASALGVDDHKFNFFVDLELSGEMVVCADKFENIKSELLSRAEKELKKADYSTAISLTTEALVICRDTKNADDAKAYFLRSVAYHLRSGTKKTPDAKSDHKQAVDDARKDAACDQKTPDYQLYKKEVEKALGLTLTL